MALPKVIVQLYPMIPSGGEAGRKARRPVGADNEAYHRIIHEWTDIVTAADAMGVWGVSTIEHHFHSEGYEVGPNPGVLNAYWAGKLSNARVGALGYVAAASEMAEQAAQQGVRLDYVVTAAGTGTTAAGLVAGFQWLGLPTKVVAVDVGRLWHDFPRSILRLAEATLRRVGRPGRIPAEALEFHAEFVGPGYAIPTVQGLNAVQVAARTEGLILEPVYTSKAMAGLMSLVQRGRFSREDTVVFLHTGGLPALYAYNEHFSR